MINKKSIKNLILEDIDTPIVLCEDIVSVDNVMCEYTNEYKFFSPEAEKFINENYKLMSNEKTFNGIIYGITNFETYGSKIFLSYEKSDYKTYLATKNKEYKKYIKENNFFIAPLGVSGIIITKDNKIIASGKTKFDNRVKLVGGFIDTEDIGEEQIKILHAIKRECKEEIGELEIFNDVIIGVVFHNCCTFITRHNTNFTSDEIKKIYKKNKFEDKYEMENMFFIENDENSIKKVILEAGMGETGKTALKFHLKKGFGNYEFYK